MHPRRWGDPDRAAGLPASAAGLVELAFGPSTPADLDPADTTVVADNLAPSRLSARALAELARIVGTEHVLTDAATRAQHTRGKSTPDLIKARTGHLEDAPDVVVRPDTHDQVVALLDWAQSRSEDESVAIVPFGGGTCVTGGLVAAAAPVVSLDLVRMNRLLDVDTESMIATLEPGVRGPQAEALLAEHGLTLGHFPQSFEFATIGGYAATRSSGQSSAGYGRFDAMVMGLRVATPIGDLDLGSSPANAAGPDLREMILGSEGTLGVITAVRLRVRRLPETKDYEGWSWPDFATGAKAMRTLAQSGELPTVLRLSDEFETAINLADPDAIGGDSAGGCLMIVGHEGTESAVTRRREVTASALTELGGKPLGEGPGAKWAHGRFDAPYLRDSLLDVGVYVETLETATFWSKRQELYDAVRASLAELLPEKHLVLCHISHVYETGCSLYFTIATRFEGDPIEQWWRAKAAVNDAIQDVGATVSHHHAVGTDHRPWLGQEIGPVGSQILQSVKRELDPKGILNPGVLIP